MEKGEPTISHINYWDQVAGKIYENSGMVYFAEIKLPSPLLNVAAHWKSSNTEACAKNLSQILASNTDNGEQEIGLRIFVRYCLKK